MKQSDLMQEISTRLAPKWLTTSVCTGLWFLSHTWEIPVHAKDATPITADEIVAKMDKNNVFETRRSMATMKIQRRGRLLEKKMRIFSKGQTTSYTEFLFPARDKGVKYLKIEDNLWMYLPSAEKVIKIAGHMLRQSMMGSDFSYEDMLDATALRERYKTTLIGQERIDAHDCYVLQMEQKKEGETYPRRKIWVSKEYFVTMRAELYALSGRLLKRMSMRDIKKFEDRNYPTVIRMENKLQRDTWTEIQMTELVFRVKLPDQVFSLRNLQRE